MSCEKNCVTCRDRWTPPLNDPCNICSRCYTEKWQPKPETKTTRNGGVISCPDSTRCDYVRERDKRIADQQRYIQVLRVREQNMLSRIAELEAAQGDGLAEALAGMRGVPSGSYAPYPYVDIRWIAFQALKREPNASADQALKAADLIEAAIAKLKDK